MSLVFLYFYLLVFLHVLLNLSKNEFIFLFSSSLEYLAVSMKQGDIVSYTPLAQGLKPNSSKSWPWDSSRHTLQLLLQGILNDATTIMVTCTVFTEAHFCAPYWRQSGSATPKKHSHANWEILRLAPLSDTFRKLHGILPPLAERLVCRYGKLKRYSLRSPPLPLPPHSPATDRVSLCSFASLNLTMERDRAVLDSWRSPCLCFLRDGVKEVHHCTPHLSVSACLSLFSLL